MKVLKFSPEKLNDFESKDKYDSPFEGYVEIEMPTYEDRINLGKSLKTGDSDNLDNAEKILNIISKRVKSVKLSIKGTEDSIDCLEELGYYKEGSDFINEIGRTLMRGKQLGNR